MWHVDSTRDTLITATNGGDKPTHAAIALFYSAGTQKYQLQQLLNPGEQMFVDVGKIIHGQLPDKSGNVIPPATMMGSYELRDADNSAGGTTTCHPKSQPVATVGTGLDSVYPYDTHNPTTDNPKIALDSTQFTEATRSFRATMYLLWSPSTPNSIAIPLGSVSWQFDADAKYDSTAGVWNVVSSSQSSNQFLTSSSYPTWNSYVPYTGPTGGLVCQ